LIERVFVWQASVKYETDQSTLDFVSQQTMHAFNEKIYNPTPSSSFALGDVQM